MKNLFIIMFLLLVGLTVHAQQPTNLSTAKSAYINSYDKTSDKVSEGVSTVYNDVKSLSPKISKAVESLGKELKVGVNKVWDVLVRQQLVWSICYLILTVSALINWFMFYKRNLSKPKMEEMVKLNRSYPKDIVNPDYDASYATNSKSYPNTYPYKPKICDTFIKSDKEIGTTEEYISLLPDRSPFWFKYLHIAICVGLSVFSYLHFSDMLTGFINPEFGAMKTIAEIATNLK